MPFGLKTVLWLYFFFLLNSLNVCSFANWRNITNLLFLSKLVFNSNDFPKLLSQINFKVPPRHAKFTKLFFVQFFSANYLFNSPLFRLMWLADKVSTFTTYLKISFHQLKGKINFIFIFTRICMYVFFFIYI